MSDRMSVYSSFRENVQLKHGALLTEYMAFRNDVRVESLRKLPYTQFKKLMLKYNYGKDYF